jgi:hypothetical protein
MKPFRSGFSLLAFALTALFCFAQVTTSQYDNFRTGATLNEKSGAEHAVEKFKDRDFPSLSFYVLYKRLTTFLTSSKHLAQRTELCSLSI